MHVLLKNVKFSFICLILLLGLLSYVQPIVQMISYSIIALVMGVFCFLLMKDTSKQEFKYLIHQQVIIIALLYVIIFIQLINSIRGDLDAVSTLKLMFYPISFFYSCLFVPWFILKAKMEMKFLHLLIYTGLCLSIYTLIYSIIMTGGSLNIPSLQTAQFLYIHPLIDSNYQGAVVSISSVLCLYMLFIKRRLKIIYALFFIINFFNLIILSSRASMLAVIICLFLLILLLGSKLLKVLTVLTGVSLIAFYPLLKNFIYANSILYNNIFDAERGSTGRLEIWGEIWRRVSHSLLTGIGTNKIEVEVAGYYVQSSHNSFLDFLMVNGLVVFCLYVVIFMIAVFKSILKIKYNPFFFVLICILVIMNFTTHNIGGVSYIPQILGILLGLIYIPKESEEKQWVLLNRR
ncbi:hypothetical protein AC623_02390 [Bacillus sp. FJAT-27231]|uniref:O-antigen ligase family protein n=1 Tax=Bacillus sp. FJAT-27231 TaxID=1679168 RepID=UPI0006711776|nr:O-antigen ligase family protein [Bacillus sp. FJAT-27231]KMY52979.1 hypothetical protein AC623_02390 [Bacillus sp. FJAT-27231]